MKWFDQVYVMSLSIRSDRLQSVLNTLPRSICDVKIWPAVHGDSTGHPSFWTSGAGAWGCYRTHVNILEDAMQRQCNSYLVLEDDAFFAEDFDQILHQFMKSLPDDWDQIYLGGQLLHEIENPPVRVNENVYMPHNVNRTHAFGVHRRGFAKIYDHLFDLPFVPGEHIDHHLGRLHEAKRFKVYVPRKWIVGQNAGSSNVSGKTRHDPDFWHDPESCARDHDLFHHPVCIFLECVPQVARLLHARGWHFGYWQTEDGLDKGVCEAVSSMDPELPLECWYNWVRREVVRENKVLPCLYHPRLNFNVVSQFKFANFIHIKADSVDEALTILERQLVSKPI